MDLGIDNLFVVDNFYGDHDVLNNAEIEDIIWYMCSERLELSLLVHKKPLNTPKKWGEFDSVNIRIGFSGIISVNADINKENLIIEEFKVDEVYDKYCCKIKIDSEQSLEFIFNCARIHNMKPYINKK